MYGIQSTSIMSISMRCVGVCGQAYDRPCEHTLLVGHSNDTIERFIIIHNNAVCVITSSMKGMNRVHAEDDIRKQTNDNNDSEHALMVDWEGGIHRILCHVMMNAFFFITSRVQCKSSCLSEYCHLSRTNSRGNYTNDNKEKIYPHHLPHFICQSSRSNSFPIGRNLIMGHNLHMA